MSENNILLIETPTKLAIDIGRLRISRDGHEDAFVLPTDIAIIIFNHSVISLSGAVLQTLTSAGAVLIVTDQHHLPSGVLWPWGGQEKMTGRLRQQIDLDQNEKQRRRLWQDIVRSRLLTQALTLAHFGLNGVLRLNRLARQVKPGDDGNLEAQGARHYWKHLLPSTIKRQKRGATDPINSRLNYGYAILRALIARELASRGLHGGLGLGHMSKENPLNLADDFIESYRFCVERQVMENQPEQPFDATARVKIAELIQREVQIKDRFFRLPAGISETVSSFVQILDGRSSHLSLTGF